ncbi:hypothetical protein ANCCAN_10630 [Ancylostoma caninum]|uniref:Uncharacterized protein n=1 Tax=Ancylostoma caninum TaxID=29170 RepID=A0A368GG54_ANCCA|nr:hypothetical protein ANCCAN_10630 [Ancylostoma caninum]
MILHISFLRKFASIRRRNQKQKPTTSQCPHIKQEKTKKKNVKKEQAKQ